MTDFDKHTVDGDAGNGRPCSGISLSMRPHCLIPDACQSKGKRHCVRCANTHRNATPDMRAVAAREMAAKHRTPKFRKANAAAQAKRNATLKLIHLDPAARARLEAVARIGRARSLEARVGAPWCPPEYQEEYRELVQVHRIGAKEARRIIEERIPGTDAHARLAVANAALAGRLKHERELGQRY